MIPMKNVVIGFLMVGVFFDLFISISLDGCRRVRVRCAASAHRTHCSVNYVLLNQNSSGFMESELIEVAL
tara:strand:+ start:2397 stop:2606 length:210 start_codon:yes stop_codon:yes gene_type:complete